MKNYNYTVTIIETEEDRKAYYMSMGIKPPLNCALVKGCFSGEDCSTIIVVRRLGESYNDAISRCVQDEINDSTLFKKLSAAPKKSKKGKK